jgi:biotin synthase-related radical SAM superfamily protein
VCSDAGAAEHSTATYPEKMRVSLGSSMVLGLLEGRLECAPTTAYLMTYSPSRCIANCGFCPQARCSTSRADLLSRVTWPVFPAQRVISAIETAYADRRICRVCVQTLNSPGAFSTLAAFIQCLKTCTSVPLSVSCPPTVREGFLELKAAGVERVSIALDAATPELFDMVKGAAGGGPYTWETHMRALREAVQVFGSGHVTTHLIVGLGETEEEMVNAISTCVEMGVLPALFAFTPVPGTRMGCRMPPDIAVYRRLQVARHLLVSGISKRERMRFDELGRLFCFGVEQRVLVNVVLSGKPFLTSGCPGCNRPFYNETPRGPTYNYAAEMSREEIAEAAALLGLILPQG